jgi:hypothetical protein
MYIMVNILPNAPINVGIIKKNIIIIPCSVMYMLYSIMLLLFDYTYVFVF